MAAPNVMVGVAGNGFGTTAEGTAAAEGQSPEIARSQLKRGNLLRQLGRGVGRGGSPAAHRQAEHGVCLLRIVQD